MKSALPFALEGYITCYDLLRLCYASDPLPWLKSSLFQIKSDLFWDLPRGDR